jgi:hypothetical protein
VKKINLLWTNDKDACCAMHELNPTHVESSDRRQASPIFFKLVQRFGVKIVPPKTPHGMNERLDPTLV